MFFSVLSQGKCFWKWRRRMTRGGVEGSWVEGRRASIQPITLKLLVKSDCTETRIFISYRLIRSIKRFLQHVANMQNYFASWPHVQEPVDLVFVVTLWHTCGSNTCAKTFCCCWDYSNIYRHNMLSHSFLNLFAGFFFEKWKVFRLYHPSLLGLSTCVRYMNII